MLPLINFGSINIYTYPLMMGIAWAIAFNCVKNNKNFSYLSFIGIFVSAWIGSKILFLITVPTHIEKLLINNQYFWLGGGFVFYGGLILAICWLIISSKIENKSILDYQFYLPGLLIGHGIGRIGCFLAGCCFGMKISNFQIPVQLMEATLLIFLYKKKELSILNYMWIYSIFRFFIEFFRADEIRGGYAYLSTSQIISITILLGLIFIKLFQSQKLLK